MIYALPRIPTVKTDGPVTDAKEVGVRNAAEETFCHRTVPVIPHGRKSGNPPFVIYSPSIAHKINTLRKKGLPGWVNSGK
jgi:hypothetical protein